MLCFLYMVVLSVFGCDFCIWLYCLHMVVLSVYDCDFCDSGQTVTGMCALCLYAEEAGYRIFFFLLQCNLLLIVKYQLWILDVRLNPAAYASVMVCGTNHIIFKP